MKISDLAGQADVTVDTVRHYVALGLLKPRRNPGNGYQEFSPKDLARLRFIRGARELGFRLEDIQAIFADAECGQSPCPRVRDLMAERLAETRRRIDKLTLLCERMEGAMEEWRNTPDSVPDGHSVCRLIESRLAAPQPEQSET